MNKFKKILALTLSSALLFTACGSTETKDAKNDEKSASKESVLVIGATPNPHVQILEKAKEQLEKDGITLEIQEFTDYIIPNTALDEKSLDANFFQHQPYLDNFNEQHSTKLVNVAKVHLEPMGVYSQKIKSLDELSDGATVTIPNDPTNGGRALMLLEKQGLITLKEGIDKLTATDKDIDKNEKNLKIQLLDAAQLPRTLDEIDIAVINTNFALEGGLNPLSDALVMEDKDSPYANIIATREDNKDDEKIKALVKAVNSDEVRKLIEEEYKGAIVPAF